MSLEELDPVTDEDDIVLPTDNPPSISALPAKQRNDVLDIRKMENKLDEYENSADDLKCLHQEWLLAYTSWQGRFNKVYGKVSTLDDSINFIIGQQPGKDFEPFEIFSVHSGITALFTVVQGGYGLYASIRALDAAKKAENVVAATRMAKLGIGMASVSLAFGAYVAFRTIKDRTDFLISTLPSMHEWYTETTSQITTMSDAVEVTLLPELRKIAEIVGASDPDDNVMYRNLIDILNQAMTDAAEVEAQLKVATRMLCKLPTPFTVADTAAATGLSETVVQTRKDEIFATTESEENICGPYRPSGS